MARTAKQITNELRRLHAKVCRACKQGVSKDEMARLFFGDVKRLYNEQTRLMERYRPMHCYTGTLSLIFSKEFETARRKKAAMGRKVVA